MYDIFIAGQTIIHKPFIPPEFFMFIILNVTLAAIMWVIVFFFIFSPHRVLSIYSTSFVLIFLLVGVILYAACVNWYFAVEPNLWGLPLFPILWGLATAVLFMEYLNNKRE